MRRITAVRGPATRRVLMTADTVGGVFAYALELCAEFEKSGVQVVLATMGAPLSTDQRQRLRALPNVDVRESLYALEWMDDAFGDVDRAGQWLLELERETRPDIVHLNGYSHGALPFRAPVLVVAHSCVFSWWQAVLGQQPPASFTEYGRRVSLGLRRAAVVVAPSRAMLRALLRCYGLLPHGRVIENGLGQGRFHTRSKEPFFLFAGRIWDRAKNLETLCRAAPSVPWPVRVAGAGGDELCAPGVEYLGLLSQAAVAEWMSRAAVFVHPALYEPFGLATLEAALSGAALLLGDIDSARELWGDAALYVDPRDPTALAEAMCRLARDAGLRERLSLLAKNRAAEYGAERMSRRYLELYAELSQRRSATLDLTPPRNRRPSAALAGGGGQS